MSRTDTAIILAAGMGRRLGALAGDLPKGLVPIGGTSLVERSLGALRARGVERVVIVAGHRAEVYHRLARSWREVEVIENKEYATTESMASLACALEVVDGDFLLLESDLFYEPCALDAVLAHGAADVVLASGPTGATDEVWVEAEAGRVRNLSKDPSTLSAVSGEFVGILRVSWPLAELLRGAWLAFQRERGHGRMAYETGALVAVAGDHPVELCLVPDLLWGELDDEVHLRRLREEVWPAFQRRARERG